MKSCKTCRYCWKDGTGYSDYTWEDTEFRCFLNLNPGLPKAEPYEGELPELNFAETCTKYEHSYSAPVPLITPDGNLSEGEERAAWIIRHCSA